jgi:heat shock protein 1/8
VSDSDRETIEKAIKETQAWLESHQSAEREVYESKQKELEGQCQPIIMKLYQGAGGVPETTAQHTDCLRARLLG